MSLVLVPYNDAMRLGQGFNSYTHELCISDAVKVSSPNEDQDSTTNISKQTSQVVSYSSRFVEKLSDVVDSLNISHSSCIKKGTVEVSGSKSTIDEDTFKSADLNAVITVKVTNETVTIQDDAEFIPIVAENDQQAITPGSNLFDSTFGDSYISGFISGGELTAVISVKVTDRTKVSQTVQDIKSGLDSPKSDSVNLNTLGSGKTSKASQALKNSETTVSISWMGGGQIKSDEEQWDLEAVFRAAAAFPARVAECPKRTWAILTKYKANRAYIKFAQQNIGKTLEYDQVATVTAELFDSYMEYKLLLKAVRDIMQTPTNFEPPKNVTNALDTSMQTLISLRSALRDEQEKIIEAVEILTRDPDALKRHNAKSTPLRVPTIKKIIDEAISSFGIPIRPKSLEGPPTHTGQSSITPSTSGLSQPPQPLATVQSPDPSLPLAPAQAQAQAPAAPVTQTSPPSAATQGSTGGNTQPPVAPMNPQPPVPVSQPTPSGGAGPSTITPPDINGFVDVPHPGAPTSPAAPTIASAATPDNTVVLPGPPPHLPRPPTDRPPITKADVDKATFDFDFSTLIPPEVWQTVLPVLKKDAVIIPSTNSQSDLLGGLLSSQKTSPLPSVTVLKNAEDQQKELDAEKAKTQEQTAKVSEANKTIDDLKTQLAQKDQTIKDLGDKVASTEKGKEDAEKKRDDLESEKNKLAGDLSQVQQQKNQVELDRNTWENRQITGEEDPYGILAVDYGSQWLRNETIPHTLNFLKERMKDQQLFDLKDLFKGDGKPSDPKEAKTLAIAFRYGRKGYVKLLSGKEGEQHRFFNTDNY